MHACTRRSRVLAISISLPSAARDITRRQLERAGHALGSVAVLRVPADISRDSMRCCLQCWVLASCFAPTCTAAAAAGATTDAAATTATTVVPEHWAPDEEETPPRTGSSHFNDFHYPLEEAEQLATVVEPTDCSSTHAGWSVVFAGPPVRLHTIMCARSS